MHINRLLLRGFKNLALSNIKELSYSANLPIQLIIGKNGSGKSSLLRELSPFPAVPSKYNEGGMKEIHLTFNGNDYVLTSIIGKTSKHSFVKNGEEELNKGGTITIQKELIENEFNLTPFLYRLITGQISFAEAPPNVRKEILLTISNLKLDYALGLFNRLKSAYRDSQGALKHVRSKHEGVRAQLQSIGDLSAIEQEKDVITDTINRIMAYTTTHRINMDTYDRTLNASVTALNNHVESYSKLALKINKQYKNKADALLALYDVEKNIHAVELNIAESVDIVAELSKLSDIVENTENGVELIEKQLVDTESELMQMGALDGLDYGTDLNKVYEALRIAKNRLCELYADVDEDMTVCDRVMHHQSGMDEAKALDVVKDLTQKQKMWASSINRAKAAKVGDVSCTNCGTVMLGEGSLSEAKLKELERNYHEVSDRLVTAIALHEKAVNVHRCNELYLRHFKRVLGIIRDYTLLLPLWNRLGGIKDIVPNIPIALDTLCAEADRIQRVIIRDKLRGERDRIKELLTNYRLAESTNACDRKIATEKKLDDLYVSLTALSKKQKCLRAIVATFDTVNEYIASYRDLREKVAIAYHEWNNALIQCETTLYVKGLHERMGTLSEVLAKKDHLEGASCEYQSDVERLVEEQTIYKDLIAELSPTTGIISDLMTGYINGFVNEINKVLASIWEYPMGLKQCGLEKNGLDYRFPLLVDGETVDDISDGSKGQIEVINFAFVIVAMAYMGLSQYPLYLDEVGTAFDYKHRSNLINYIKALVEGRHCSQLFLVNHYSSEYGGLSHAETLALTTDGAVLPDKYNTHVQITYN